MKMNLTSGKKLQATILAALLGAGTYLSQAAPPAPPSPVGGWDCISSGGGQQGITILSFSSNHTFSGYVLIAGIPSQVGSSGGRNAGGDAGRNGGSTSTGATNNTIFGFGGVSGPWGFDINGKVIGFLSEAINVSSFVTNYSIDCPPGIVIQFLVTNSDATTYPAQTNFSLPCFSGPVLIVTNYWTADSTNDGNPNSYSQVTTIADPNFTVVAGSAEATNSVSFTGTVVPGKRLTLVAATSFGKVTYTGVPLKTNLTDLAGNWYGYKKQNGQSFLEFFHLTLSAFPNIYFMDGSGPGYGYTNGTCILSAQKKVGFAVIEGGANSALRATFGSVAIKRNVPTVQTKGSSAASNTAISFDAAALAP